MVEGEEGRIRKGDTSSVGAAGGKKRSSSIGAEDEDKEVDKEEEEEEGNAMAMTVVTAPPPLSAAAAADYQVTPTGLTNLGATCYLNVLFQAMLFNKSFCKAVYKLRPPFLLQQQQQGREDGRDSPGAAAGVRTHAFGHGEGL
jgi:hypothetical protein